MRDHDLQRGEVEHLGADQTEHSDALLVDEVEREDRGDEQDAEWIIAGTSSWYSLS